MKKMVIVKKSGHSLYSETNRALLAVLNSSISQEKKEISRLEKEEQQASKVLKAEETKIRHQHLRKKKVKVSKTLHQFHNSLNETKKQLQQKQQNLKEMEQTVSALNRQILAKDQQQEQLDEDLELRLTRLVKNNQDEINRIVKEKKTRDLHIISLKKKQDLIKKDIEKKEKALISQDKKESVLEQQKLKQLQINQEKELARKGRELKLYQNKIEVQKRKIALLNSEREKIEQFVSTLTLSTPKLIKNGINYPPQLKGLFLQGKKEVLAFEAKKDGLSQKGKQTHQQLINSKEKIITEIQGLKKRKTLLENEIQKDKVVTLRIDDLNKQLKEEEGSLQAQQNRFNELLNKVKEGKTALKGIKGNIVQEKSKLSQEDSKKQHFELAKAEVVGLLNQYKQEFDDLQNKKKELEKKATLLEKNKQQMLTQVETDSLKLKETKERAESSLVDLENKKKSELAQVDSLLKKIKQQEQSIFLDNKKVEEINISLNKFKSSPDWTEVVLGFRKQKEKVRNEINLTQQAVDKERKEIGEIKQGAEQYCTKINQKIKAIKSLQGNILKERSKHKAKLESINQSLSQIKSTVDHISERENLIKSKKEPTLNTNIKGIQENISRMVEDISKIKQEYSSSLTIKQDIEKEITELNKKQLEHSSKIKETQKLLSSNQYSLEKEKRKYVVLLKEEKALNQVVGLIQLKLKKLDNVKKEYIQDKNQISLAKSKIKAEVRSYLMGLQKQIKLAGIKRISSIRKRVALEKSRTEINKQNKSVEKKELDQLIIEKEKQFQEKHNQFQLLLKRQQDKIDLIKKVGFNRINMINKDIAKIQQSIKADENQIKKQQKDSSLRRSQVKKRLSERKHQLAKEEEKLKSNKSKSKNTTTSIQRQIAHLNEEIKFIINHSAQLKTEQERIAAEFKAKDDQSKMLNKIVNEKVKRIKEKRKLKQELRQLELILSDELKGKIEQEAQKIAKVDTAEKVREIRSVKNKELAEQKKLLNSSANKRIDILRKNKSKELAEQKELLVKAKAHPKIIVKIKRIKVKPKTIVKTVVRVRKVPVIKKVRVIKRELSHKDKKNMQAFLENTDNLLGKLSDKEISKFARSKNFIRYKKIMEKYNIK
ncbi:hypothetical protein COY27_05490 [Candidatus Woesearchaeota archaeon CG_4_10_14_0_2_um_filter_33_13]|nr:MAG: hypothetical protein COY27_05490 [Candidatus Woesearchaeota archaeon CG_4_10_14_0_2_um_filter_33_13]